MGKNLDMAVYAAILGMSDDELITASFLPDVNDHGHPRAPRMRTLIRASVASAQHPRKEPVEETTLVRNVSERGMCLLMRGRAPHAGDIVIVRLPTNQEFRAQVRWSDGRACGVQLFEKLDVDALTVTPRRGANTSIPATGPASGVPLPLRSATQPMRAC